MQLPGQMNKLVFITSTQDLRNGNMCEPHTITLMSYTNKLVLHVRINIIQDNTLDEIATVQYGYIPGRRTINSACVERNINIIYG